MGTSERQLLLACLRFACGVAHVVTSVGGSMSRADLKPNQRAHLPVETIAVSEKPKAGAPVVPHGGWSSRVAPQTICFPCTTTQVTEILLLNHKLLAALVVELGGDWNTTTVNELTVVPSEDVESCIRGLHINGALECLLQRDTLVRTWRSLMTAAGVAHQPLELLYLFLHLRLHRLSLWARVQKQDGARERPATPRGRSTGQPQSRKSSRPWIGSRLGDDLSNARGAKWVKTATTKAKEVWEERGFRWIGPRR